MGCLEVKTEQRHYFLTIEENRKSDQSALSGTMVSIYPPSTDQQKDIVTFLDQSTRYAIIIPVRNRAQLNKIIRQTLRPVTVNCQAHSKTFCSIMRKNNFPTRSPYTWVITKYITWRAYHTKLKKISWQKDIKKPNQWKMNGAKPLQT